MRFVQISVPKGKRERFLSVLDEEEIDYLYTDETSGRGYVGVVSFPLPTEAVEPVLAKLRDAGMDEESYTVVLEAETILSRQYDELEERYDGETENGKGIAREELKARADELASSVPTYVTLTIVSAVVATAGLLLDSPATVVGSMVIAPLIGPAMATAVGSVVDDEALFSRGVRMQVLGMVLSVAAAAVFAFSVRHLRLIPPGLAENVGNIEQVRERIAPDFLSLVVALGSGVAGAISLTTGVSTALVGVMIAVALVPPAATVGIGLAFGDVPMALSSGVLAIVNGLSINLAALLVLWKSGYRPERFFRRDRARAALVRRVAVLVVVIGLLSVFLGGVTYDSYRTANTESRIEMAVDEVFDADGPYDERYSSLTAFETEVTFVPQEPIFVLHRPETVVVTVGVPPDASTDGVATAIEQQVSDVAGVGNVSVQVRYVEFERGNSEHRRLREPHRLHEPRRLHESHRLHEPRRVAVSG